MSARLVNGRWIHIAAGMMGHFSTTFPNISKKSSYESAFTALISIVSHAKSSVKTRGETEAGLMALEA